MGEHSCSCRREHRLEADPPPCSWWRIPPFELYIPNFHTFLQKPSLPEQTCHVVPIPWPSARTTTCSDLTETSSAQRSTLFRSGFPGIRLAYLLRVSVQTDHSCSVTILKFLVIFQLGVLHFTWGPAIFITSLDYSFLSLQHYTLAICGYFCLKLLIHVLKELVHFLKILAKFHLLREAFLNHHFYRSPHCLLASIHVSTYHHLNIHDNVEIFSLFIYFSILGMFHEERDLI